MEIKNEEHAREMIGEWQKLPVLARNRAITLAIQKLELSSMYYEQKGNERGAERVARCLVILKEHFTSLDT